MSTCSVLVVDDSPEDREVVRRHLRRGGTFEVREAETGEEGLAACRSDPPDCVLLDLNLPDMTGLELLEALADGRGVPPVPVVLLSSVEERSQVAAALQGGAQDYLVKGETTPAGLERAVGNAMEKFAIQRALAERSAALERKNRELEAYASVVAHDLRNPLGAVSMSAQFLLDVIPDESGRALERRQLEVIVRAVERANRLVKDLLDVSRIEAGSLSLECEWYPVEELVREALEVKAAAAPVRHALATEVEPGLPAVCVDRDRLLRVFQNLLDNAAKFTPDGGRITVRALRDGGRVRFEVEDTGCGIAADQLPHVFDRFWQARGTDSRGAGLGLAIVKGIVEAHGGTIRAESTVGSGTTFRFSIPPEGASAPPSP